MVRPSEQRLLTEANANAAFARQVDARDSFTNRANGSLSSGETALSGHPYAVAKNVYSTGYKIVDGYLMHDQGTTTDMTADYAGIKLPGRVGRIWADFRYPTSAIPQSENLVLIVSDAVFAKTTPGDSFANAAAHFNITRTGWSYEILQKTPFTITQIASGVFATPLAFDTDYQVAVEYSGTTATIYLPDGTIKTATHGNIDAWRGQHATIEHYAFDGSARSLLQVRNWGADVEKTDLSRPLTLDRIRSAVGPKAMQYIAAAASTIAASGSAADVDTVNMALTFTVPPSGKVIVEVEAFIEITTSGHYLLGLAHNGTGGYGGGLKRIHIGTCSENKRTRWVMNGFATPYQVVTIRLQHLIASGGVGGVKVGPGDYYVSMSAIPVL